MELRLETPIDAPADAAWQLLGPEFAQIDRWSSFVRTSRPIDRSEVPAGTMVAPTAPVPGRETTTKATLIEVLTAYSDDERTLTFEGVGLPPVVSYAGNTQSIVETGPNSSAVVFEVRMDFKGPFKLLGPVMKRRMQKTFGAVQADLARHAAATV